MWKMIIGQAIFQIVVNLTLLNVGKRIFDTIDITPSLKETETMEEHEDKVIRTMVFNTFVFMQIFNEFNGRRIDDRLNVFEGILQHRIFQAIFFITVFFQALVVEFGGPAFKTTHLQWQLWLICVAIALISLPGGVLIRLIPDFDLPCFRVEGKDLEPESSTTVLIDDKKEKDNKEPQN